MERRDLVKAGDNLLDGFCFDEVSDSGITAGAERLVLRLVEDLVDERFQYEKELVIRNLGDWLNQVSRRRHRLGDHIQ